MALLLLCLNVAADNQSDARKVLDKTAAIVGRKGGSQASFQISGSKMGTHSGTIAIKGNKFCAKTEGTTMWYDGKTQWTYMKKSNEVNVATPSASKQQAMNPYTFLKLYKKGYKLSLKKDGNRQQVHMEATGKASIQEVYVTVDSNYLPVQVRMRQNNAWTTIVISNFKAVDQQNSTFQFNSKDYPKAEVIDLR